MLQEQLVSPQLTAWLATIYDFESSVEELIVCTRYIKDTHLVVNT